VESDDYGRSKPGLRLPAGKLGTKTTCAGIRSFRKLTGEGVTLIGSDDLYSGGGPAARFGRQPLDYQLLERKMKRDSPA